MTANGLKPKTAHFVSEHSNFLTKLAKMQSKQYLIYLPNVFRSNYQFSIK